MEVSVYRNRRINTCSVNAKSDDHSVSNLLKYATDYISTNNSTPPKKKKLLKKKKSSSFIP